MCVRVVYCTFVRLKLLKDKERKQTIHSLKELLNSTKKQIRVNKSKLTR